MPLNVINNKTESLVVSHLIIANPIVTNLSVSNSIATKLSSVVRHRVKKMMAIRLFTMVITVLTASLLACTPPPDVDNKNATDGNASLILKACDQESYPSGLARSLECGDFEVAENPRDPQSRKIHLNVARLPAISARPESDPLFIFAGGPGQAATEIIVPLYSFIAKINQQRDVVFIDQRGTGHSHPLDCEPTEPFNYDLSFQAVEKIQLDGLKECLENFDADLQFYTTPYAIDDFNAVREALGYEKINLWGGSYGTRAALVYLRRHPQTVRSVILDGVAPVDMKIPQYFSSDAEDAMQRVLTLCENNASCSQQFGDIKNTLKTVVQRLDENPQRIVLRHPATQEDMPVQVSGELISSYFRLSLYSREMSALLPWLIQAIHDEDYRALSVMISSAETTLGGLSIGLQYSVLCNEDIREAVIEDAQQKDDNLLELNLTAGMKKVCEFWPTASLPDNYNEPVKSDIPTLILSGELDPVTPPYWGEKTAQTLSNSHHVIVSGAHHGVSTLGCVPDMLDQFIQTTTFDALNENCVKKIQPHLPFVSAAGPAMNQNSAEMLDNKDENNLQPSRQELIEVIEVKDD